MKPFFVFCFCLLTLLVACNGSEEEVISTTKTFVETPDVKTSYPRLYVLNEGNMGMNKASLDFLDYTKGMYNRHAFTGVNPMVTLELGDVGNNILQYGSKMYIVLTNSNLIEVVDALSLKHITSISLPLCRQLVAKDGFLYVTTFSGEFSGKIQQGSVVAIDTTSLTITNRLIVGREPEGISIVDNNLYIAISGGYHQPNYDHRLAVVNIEDLSLVKYINVGLNPMLVKTLNDKTIAVATLGDHEKLKGKIYFIDIVNESVTDSINASLHSWWYDQEQLYCLESSLEESTTTVPQLFSYHVNTQSIQSFPRINNIIKKMEHPYAIAVHPENKNIYISDAKDYVSPGLLYCFTQDENQKWTVQTGDIPGHFAFVKRSLNNDKNEIE